MKICALYIQAIMKLTALIILLGKETKAKHFCLESSVGFMMFCRSIFLFGLKKSNRDSEKNRYLRNWKEKHNIFFFKDFF